MTKFLGTIGNDVANAALGELTGFTGGDVDDLTDGTADFFAGGEGEDFIFAANTDDLIEGGEGHDALNGGGGDDIIYGNTEPDPGGSLIGDEIIGNIGFDRLVGANGDDVMDGGADADILSGNGGNDLMLGGFGDDQVFGGTGADTLQGGSGNDILGFVPGDVLPGEVIDGGSDFDIINCGDAISFTNAASITGIEAIDLAGGGTTATFTAFQVRTNLPADLRLDGRRFPGSDETFRIEMGSETVLDVAAFTFGASWEFNDRIDIIGDANDEVIAGSVQFDRIFGNGGGDTLIGNGGVDQLFGGRGSDVYLVDQAGGEVVERAGQGTDSVLAFLTYFLAANVENLTLLGTGHINGTGNTLANTIIGNSGTNFLDGGQGIDSLRGGLGNDTYTVNKAGEAIESLNEGTDTVLSTVNYTLGAHIERLQLSGSANHTGTGNGLDNRITGNGGDNGLDGLGGKDTLTGNAGADRFRFTTALNAATNVDKIADFEVGIDEIRIDNAIFTGLGAGGLAAGRFRIGSAAADSSDRIVYNDTTGALFFDSDGVGGAAQVRFATLDTGLALTAGDFFVI